MDLLKTVRALKPVRGQRMSDWLQRFLVAPPDQLDQWSGRFTEVVTAKAVAIYRKRGVLEEHEAQRDARFAVLVNACYRAMAFSAEETVAPEPENIENETADQPQCPEHQGPHRPRTIRDRIVRPRPEG